MKAKSAVLGRELLGGSFPREFAGRFSVRKSLIPKRRFFAQVEHLFKTSSSVTIVSVARRLPPVGYANDRIELLKAKQRNMPDPIPAVLIGRLAVDVRYQGQRIGLSLLQDALDRTIAASQSIGVAYILVQALNDAAKRFYEKNGFVAIPEQPLTLFLAVATAAAAMQSEQ